MIEIAERIIEVVRDYRNHDGINLTSDHVLAWAGQFGEDAEFMLKELDHLLPQIYVSRQKAKDYILEHLNYYIPRYAQGNLVTFLMDTEYLDLQQPLKSQPAILQLLEEVLQEQYGESYLAYTTFPKRNYIYMDDVLASGSTIGRHMVEFLKGVDQNNTPFSQKLLAGEINLSVNVFCLHRWGFEFQNYRLKKQFEGNVSAKIRWTWNYEVENHGKFLNQKLNVAKPLKGNNAVINSYLESLAADKYADYAYREQNKPTTEQFFTSAANRARFETILVEKGIEIIGMIKGEVKTNIRPLGLINPAYKIFGLGTHFFTWRNIPNNSPLVYWWEVEGHHWRPLFPVANRG